MHGFPPHLRESELAWNAALCIAWRPIDCASRFMASSRLMHCRTSHLATTTSQSVSASSFSLPSCATRCIMTPSRNEPPSAIVTLLFVHGGGFCKEIWAPIIRRVRQSPVWSSDASVRFQVEAIDLPFHGSNRDNHGGVASVDDVEPRVICDNKRALVPSCRVIHPANVWVEWTTAAVLNSVDRLRDANSVTDFEASASTPRHLLIGIGHSMGASALWNAEVSRPGSFASLVLFEPIYGHRKEYDASAELLDMVVAVTLQREATWCVHHHLDALLKHPQLVLTYRYHGLSPCRPSLAAAKEHIAGSRRFASWDPESLEQWMNGAIVPATDGSVALACAPIFEASFSCGPPLWLPKSALVVPKCPILVHYASDSRLFQPHVFRALAKRLPGVYRVPAQPIQRCTHLMVVENPAECADRVLDVLQRLSGTRQSFPSATTAARL